MKIVKKISLLVIAIITSQSIVCAQQKIDYNNLPQESSDQWIYSFVETFEPINGRVIEQPVTVKKEGHYLDDGLTITKTSLKIMDNMIVTTTETWITKDPYSFVDAAVDVAKGVAVGAAIAAPIAIGINTYNIQQAHNKQVQELNEIMQYLNAGQQLPADKSYNPTNKEFIEKLLTNRSANPNATAHTRTESSAWTFYTPQTELNIPTPIAR